MILVTVILFAAAASPLTASASSTHLISPGETLYSIAARYGVNLDELARMNGISNPNMIYAGASLQIPGATFGSTTLEQVVHVVVAGDSIYSIARQYGVPVESILASNGEVSNPDFIYPGQQILVAGNRVSGGGSPAPSATGIGEIESLLEYYANLYGLSPSLVKAIAWQESGWRQNVTSSAGAIGVMQVMPATGGWVASSIVGRPLNLYDTHDNILAGVAYLDWLIRYTGNLEIAVASYYQGPGNMSRYGMFAETRLYVDNVFAIQNYILAYGAPPYP
jgi:N-acetylmuramoyl-L-alanine amidase